MKLNEGLVQIYFGNGKGKTTAALGTAIRALGSGMKVHLVQFMKSKETGEIKSLEKFQNFSFKRFSPGVWYSAKDSSSAQANKKSAQEALNHLILSFSKKYDIIIADEILYALQFNLIEEAQVINLINSKPKATELILTGSHKPFPNLFKLADLITEIKKIKHPFDNGIEARKGIEL